MTEETRGWKKGGDLFDLAMGTYDGVEVCELVGSMRNKSGTQLERKKKQKLQRLFKEYDLEIVAESKQTIVNSLDVTLNVTGWHF